MLSNLHSFHFGGLLQNSSALPWHVYQSTTNKLLLSPLKSTAATTTKSSPSATPTTPRIKPRPLKRPAPYLAKHSTAQPQAAKPEKIKQGNFQPSNQPAQKWKPGHGVIEKVDKATGEIMHLSLEKD